MTGDLRESLRKHIHEEQLKKLRAFDVVGDIAVVKLPKELLSNKHLIGEALMKIHNNVRTVLNQISPVKGEFRTRELEVIAGEPKTETVYHESGCRFKVDLAKTYFSPRLATERMRVVGHVRPGDVVVNMFAGVGTYSVLIAKFSESAVIYSIDKNRSAFEYMQYNIRINKVGERVIAIYGDAREVLEKRLAEKADRVLMPLPKLSHEFFDVALTALKPSGGTVHFYDFGQEPDIFGPAFDFTNTAAGQRGFSVKLLGKRKIRSYATRCYHVALDLEMKKIS